MKEQTGRFLAQKQYPNLKYCEICLINKATERHHIDKNTLNNKLVNIIFCCRKCHMEIDGRNNKLASQSKLALNTKYGEFKTHCKICNKNVGIGKTTNGRCKTCSSYWYRNGTERPYKNQDGRSNQGTKHPSSKLTEAQIIEIKQEPDSTTNAELAKRYNVSWPTINKIRKGLRYSYIKVTDV